MIFGILIGIAAIPLLWVALCIIGILYKTTRDAVKIIPVPMKPGYRRYNIVWVFPVYWVTCFREQCWSWCNGIETTTEIKF